MACVIAATSSGSGKTLLSLLLLAWARSKGLNIQPFKVGPDYLDAQYLSKVANNACRNLDLLLCGPKWVTESFHGYGGLADLVLVEGVMGLFDGIGSSEEGSTAAVAKHLNLPVVLVVDASGQAASIAALVNGFLRHDPALKIAGVVLNQVNTSRHRALLTEVLDRLGVKVLGCLPRDPSFALTSRNLGLVPAHELKNLDAKLQKWTSLAIKHLDLPEFHKLLLPPISSKDPIRTLYEKSIDKFSLLPPRPVAIAEDDAFHFRYQETKDCLEALGMPLISWKPLEDVPLPLEAQGLIIPGGFPEQYAFELSKCLRSLSDISSWFGRRPIYAECGGMMLLGESISDSDGTVHEMAGLLPFQASRGNLNIGYRFLLGKDPSLIVREGQSLVGHEFHRWDLKIYDHKECSLIKPWTIKGFNSAYRDEGWANNLLHASWVHLHWASSSSIPLNFRIALDKLDAL